MIMAAGGCPGDNGMTVPVDAPPPVQVDPTLASIQVQIFTPRCAVTACHTTEKNAGLLILEAGKSHAELVGVNPANTTARNAGKKLVDPGSPDNSFLIHKLDGNLLTGASNEGKRMPLNRFPLWPEEIAPIRQWIVDGALDN
jgi:hypothetical protein